MDDRRVIALAAEKPFRLGALSVRPALRELVHDDGRRETLEPKVMQVLTALASAEAEIVTREDLTDSCWEGRVVGEDAIDRVIARLRRISAGIGADSFRIETVIKVGYRLVPADGGADPAPGPAYAPKRLRRRDVVLAGGAAVVAVGGGVLAYRGLRSPPKAAPLIAVLPFDNLSRDPDLSYFADGLAEDILNGLIRGGGVRVLSSSSSFAFRGSAKTKAAEALKADYLLDGSVLREGSRMRIHVHLDEVATRQTLWSQNYDRAVGQGLQFEDEVVRDVATALKVQVGPRVAVNGQIDPQAFDFYLQGRDANRIHSHASLQRGNELLRAAVARAPDFPPAWFELAKNYWRSGFLQPIAEQNRGFELGRQAARRAIALDPGNGAALGVLTQLTPAFGHWAEIDQGLSRAAAISPNDPNIVLWRAIFLFQTGRLRAAVQEARRAQLLDPMEIYANHLLCLTLTSAEAYKDAELQAGRLAQLWPEQLATYWDRFWLLVASGRERSALALLEDRLRRPANESEEYRICGEALQAFIAGTDPSRRSAGRALIGLAANGTGYAANAMLLLAKLGLGDEAVEVARGLYLRQGSIRIDHAVEFLADSRFPLHGEARSMMLFHPLLRPLRRAGRLDAVFDGIGLTGFWRTAGRADN